MGQQPVHSRIILHLDMDAFYASVEELDNPAIRGKPVIVGGGEKRGVVSAASYKAREFGIHSALPMATAKRRCPQGIFLPVRMVRYQEISALVLAIFKNYTPLVEPLSLDEAFLDVTDSSYLFGSGQEMALEIKKLVKKTTGLTISAGVASNKLLAKIASDLEKPDGLTVVPTDEEKTFLAPLPIKKLWGVGRATQKKLALLSVRTIGDLCNIPAEILQAKFGKLGTWMHQSAQGIDFRSVISVRPAKSIGNEKTFAADLTAPKEIHPELLALADKVGRRLRQQHLAGKTVTLKIKYADFSLISRSRTMPDHTNDQRIIFHTILDLLKKTLAGKKPLRLLGITVGQLSHVEYPRQTSLLEDFQKKEKRKSVNEAVDSIKEKFGGQAILPGTLINHDTKDR